MRIVFSILLFLSSFVSVCSQTTPVQNFVVSCGVSEREKILGVLNAESVDVAKFKSLGYISVKDRSCVFLYKESEWNGGGTAEFSELLKQLTPDQLNKPLEISKLTTASKKLLIAKLLQSEFGSEIRSAMEKGTAQVALTYDVSVDVEKKGAKERVSWLGTHLSPLKIQDAGLDGGILYPSDSQISATSSIDDPSLLIMKVHANDRGKLDYKTRYYRVLESRLAKLDEEFASLNQSLLKNVVNISNSGQVSDLPKVIQKSYLKDVDSKAPYRFVGAGVHITVSLGNRQFVGESLKGLLGRLD